MGTVQMPSKRLQSEYWWDRRKITFNTRQVIKLTKYAYIITEYTKYTEQI